MKVEKNRVVAVSYDLQVEGETVDRATAETPLEYIHGTHMLIPRFEAEIEGTEEGSAFTFTVPPEEGYGPYDEKMLFNVPTSAFMVNGVLREDLLREGRIVPMMGRDGNVVQALIVSIQ